MPVGAAPGLKTGVPVGGPEKQQQRNNTTSSREATAARRLGDHLCLFCMHIFRQPCKEWRQEHQAGNQQVMLQLCAG